MSEDFEAATEGLGDGRRSFLKKMAVGTAFTVPVVSSFTMAGIKAVLLCRRPPRRAVRR